MVRFTSKLMLPLFAGALLFSSCSSSKNAAGTPTRNDIKGNWILDDITYDGISASERLKITLLDEGSDVCLKGSTWELPNNGNGSYTIVSTQSGCAGGEKNIVWSYRTEGDQPIFQFKRLVSGEKAKNIADGYRFKIISASSTNMSLQSEVNYMGNTILINYAFTKQ